MRSEKKKMKTIQSHFLQDFFPMAALTICSCFMVIHLPDFTVNTVNKVVELLEYEETLIKERKHFKDIIEMKRALG